MDEATSPYLDDPRFGQTFELPACPSSGRSSSFKITYADYGYHNEADPEEENVLLLFSPLMGSRLLHVFKDSLAKKRKIRIINADRPGFGGTDPVDPASRMAMWLEAIPALLKHLAIPRVSVACSSGGTLYALDLLVHHPEILHPDRPYLAIAGPWILPVHTGSTVSSILQALPSFLISGSDRLASFVNVHLGPPLGVSFGLSQALVHKITPWSTNSDTGLDREGARLEEELWSKLIEKIYSQSMEGLSADALLLLQKVDGMAGWSDWGDYDVLIPRFAETLRSAGKRLTVDIFYAESDYMIGDGRCKGSLWFDQLWEAQADVIDHHSEVVKGADHDRVLNLRWGAMQKVLDRVSPLVEVL